MQKLAMSTDLCDLHIHVNGEQTFFIDKKIISRFSGKVREMMMNQENPRKNLVIEVKDFPGGPDGFELISRFCYNNGRRILITLSNVAILHCCSVYLDMSEKVSRTRNLVERTETFLEGMFYWSLNDLLVCLKSCGSFADYADSIGLLPKLIRSLLSKIVQNSSHSNVVGSSSSSSSSPESSCGLRFSSLSSQAWWFDHLTILSPRIIEKTVITMGSNGNENNNITITRFIIHYLKTSTRKKNVHSKTAFVELASRAVDGVILVGKSAFTCRGLFWVLRVIVSGFGLSKIYRTKLESLIGGLLDKATLDDLLVRSSGHDHGCVYDVNLVLRLIKVFVYSSCDDYNENHVVVLKMKKVGRLIDKYLCEIAPDHKLRNSKFVAALQSLPDSARDCFDGVYRAIDIYLESHPNLSNEEQSRLCRCLNYEKLSLEACKNLAKNPRIPPRIAVQALISQQSKVPQAIDDYFLPKQGGYFTIKNGDTGSFYSAVKRVHDDRDDDEMSSWEEINREDMRVNLERMRWRVLELERVCKDMKCQMSKAVNDSSVNVRGLPRLC